RIRFFDRFALKASILRCAGDKCFAHPFEDFGPFIGRSMVKVIWQVPSQSSPFCRCNSGRINSAPSYRTGIHLGLEVANWQSITMLDRCKERKAVCRRRTFRASHPRANRLLVDVM